MTLEQDYRDLGFHGLSAIIRDFVAAATREGLTPQQILERVAFTERDHRRTRSFAKRLRRSRLGAFAELADFDWDHPTRIDRGLVEQAFGLRFVDEGGAVLFVGDPGLGKTHLAKALVHRALADGRNARFVLARVLCDDLAAQETTAALERRLHHYAHPHLHCIDELACPHIDIRRLDLLYEVIRRRYETRRAIVVTAPLLVPQWSQVMPSTAATAALIDRLLHRATVIHIEGESYRQRQARERAVPGRR